MSIITKVELAINCICSPWSRRHVCPRHRWLRNYAPSTRSQSSMQLTRVDSMLLPPHRPTGHCLPNASLTLWPCGDPRDDQGWWWKL